MFGSCINLFFFLHMQQDGPKWIPVLSTKYGPIFDPWRTKWPRDSSDFFPQDGQHPLHSPLPTPAFCDSWQFKNAPPKQNPLKICFQPLSRGLQAPSNQDTFGWDILHLSGKLLPVFHSKNFLISNLNQPSFNLKRWTTSGLLPNCPGFYFKLWPLKKKKRRKRGEKKLKLSKTPAAAPLIDTQQRSVSFLEGPPRILHLIKP